MIINKFNIDKWLFDYFEGNLSTHECIELERFLENNPQFEIDFDSWQDSYTDEIEIPSYSNQHLYKKSGFAYRYIAIAVLLLSSVSISYFVLNKNVEEERIVSIDNEKEEESSSSYRSNTNKNDFEYKKSIVPKTTTKKREFLQEQKGGVASISVRRGKGKEKEGNKIGDKTIGDLDALDSNSKTVKGKSSKKRNNHLVRQKKNKANKQKEQRVKGKGIVQHRGIAVSKKRDFYNKKRKKVKPIKHKKQKNKELAVYSNQKEGDAFYKKQYAYLEFKREEKRRKVKEEKASKELKKELVFSDNIALIGATFNKHKKESKKNKREKYFSRLMQKELALVNTYDPIFILEESNPIANNIALTGGLGVGRFKINNFGLLVGKELPYWSSLITADYYLKEINAGVGVELSRVENVLQGFNVNRFSAIYSQRFNLFEKTTLSTAVKYNLSQNTVQNSSVFYTHSITLGAWYDGGNFYGGINLDNIKTIKNKNNNANEFAESINPFKFAIQLGTDYRRNPYSALVISPQVNYKKVNNNGELWAGATVKYKHLVTGLGASVSNSYKVNLGVQGDKLRLIYGFVYTKSLSLENFYGKHEISLRYLIRGKNNWKKQ